MPLMLYGACPAPIPSAKTANSNFDPIAPSCRLDHEMESPRPAKRFEHLAQGPSFQLRRNSPIFDEKPQGTRCTESR